jgi:hypothetical protein
MPRAAKDAINNIACLDYLPKCSRPYFSPSVCLEKLSVSLVPLKQLICTKSINVASVLYTTQVCSQPAQFSCLMQISIYLALDNHCIGVSCFMICATGGVEDHLVAKRRTGEEFGISENGTRIKLNRRNQASP